MYCCEKVVGSMLDLLSKRLLPFHEGQYLGTCSTVRTFTLHIGKDTARASANKTTVLSCCIISHMAKSKIYKHVSFCAR